MGSKYTKRYTEEFKRDAIALVDSSGRTVTAVARELGISSESLRGWYRKAKADRFLRDGCPRCQRSAHAFDQAGSRLMPLYPHGGLHPAQCRNRETGLTPTRLFCGACLGSMAAQPPQPEITPSLWRLQNRITSLLSAATDPLEACRYFTGLRVMSAVLQATWPQGRRFAPTGLSDALDEHVDQLKQRAGERKDHAERLRWDAPPRSAGSGDAPGSTSRSTPPRSSA